MASNNNSINSDGVKLDREKVASARGIISTWYRRYRGNSFSKLNACALTYMALHNFMGYDQREILEVGYSELDLDESMSRITSLEKIYDYMVNRLSRKLLPYSKHYVTKKSRESFYGNLAPEEGDEGEGYADWYNCNTIDPSDGSKYIGYLQREYQGSRFGTYPIHDNYSEESFADDNPWE